jgi:hypothetical protein
VILLVLLDHVRTPPCAASAAEHRHEHDRGQAERLQHESRAWASLAETLAVMSAHVILEASITVPLDGRALDSNGIVGDDQLSTTLRSAIDALARAARD